MAKGQVTVGDQPRADTRQLTQDVKSPTMDYRVSNIRQSTPGTNIRSYSRQPRRYWGVKCTSQWSAHGAASGTKKFWGRFNVWRPSMARKSRKHKR